MQNIRIRALEKTETETALSLVQAVFMQYEAPDDTPEGVQEFDKSIRDDAFLSRLTFYGA